MMTTGVATSETAKKSQESASFANLKAQLQGAKINNDFEQVERLSKLCELTAALDTMKESMRQAITEHQFRQVAALAERCEQHREEIAQLSGSEESLQLSSHGVPKDIITQVTVPTNMTPRTTSRTDVYDSQSSIEISEVNDEESTIELTEDEMKGNSISTGLTSGGNTTATTTSNPKQPNKPKMNLRNILKKHEKKAPPPPPPAPEVDFFGSMGSIPFLKPQEDKKKSPKKEVRKKKKGTTQKTKGKAVSKEEPVEDSDAAYIASKNEKKPEITITATHTEADIELWKTMNNVDRLQNDTIQNRPAQMLPLMPSPRKTKSPVKKFSDQGERAFSRPDDWLKSGMKSPEKSYTTKEDPTEKSTMEVPLVDGKTAKGKGGLPRTSWHSTTSTGSSKPKTLPKTSWHSSSAKPKTLPKTSGHSTSSNSKPKTLPKTSWHSSSGNSKPKTLPKTSWHSSTGNSKPKMLPRTSSHSASSWDSMPETVEEDVAVDAAVPSEVTASSTGEAAPAKRGSIKNRINLFSGK